MINDWVKRIGHWQRWRAGSRQASGRPIALLRLLAGAAVLLWASPAFSSDIVIVGDTGLKPCVEILAGLKKSLDASYAIYTPAEANGKLDRIVAAEGARTVIALGRDAIDDALRLPPSVAVIYGLVILPVKTARPNTTGVYMATPVSEYVSLIRKYLPSLRQVSLVSSPELQRILGGAASPLVTGHHASTSFEMVKAINQLTDVDALLVLPDVSLLTPTVMEEIYLFSFRKKVPLLGLAERHVKQGALLALVFDPESLGRQIGEKAMESLQKGDAGTSVPSAARKYHLYLNRETARKMNIQFPDELLRRARKEY